MLLCLVKGLLGIDLGGRGLAFLFAFLMFGMVFRRGCWGADKTGMGNSGWSAGSYEVTFCSAGSNGPGTADTSLEGQQGAAAD